MGTRRCAAPVLAALVLAAGGAAAVAGEPRKPPPAGGVVDPRKGMEQCPKCGSWHPKGFICCCPICGGCHVKGLKCRREPVAPKRTAICPVCGTAFKAALPFGRNDAGGVDGDFCRHSVGSVAVEALVWMCPGCGYARFCPYEQGPGRVAPGEFSKPVDGATRREVLAKVQPLLRARAVEILGRMAGTPPAEVEQSDIPDWLKYELALATAELRAAPAAERAKLALEGSYACRRAMVAALDVPALTGVILACERAIENCGGRERQPETVIAAVSVLQQPGPGKAVTPENGFYLSLRLAGCCDRVGDPAAAAEALNEAERRLKAIALDEAGRQALARLVRERRKLLEMESAFRGRAVAAMRTALVEDRAYPDGAVLPTAYLLGELYRRQGEFGRARVWLALASKLAGGHRELSARVEEVAALPAMKSAVPDAAEEDIALALVERLTGRKPVFEEPKPAPGPAPGPRPEPRPEPRPKPGPAPKTCSGCLAAVGRAYAAYVARHGRAPAELAELASGGFVAEAEVNGFKCPECGEPFVYRPPNNPRDPKEMILLHLRCRKALFADGKVKDL